jgi:hypothetical protein
LALQQIENAKPDSKNNRFALALVSTMGGVNWQNYLNKMQEQGVNAHDAASILHVRVQEKQVGLSEWLLKNIGKADAKVKYTQVVRGSNITSTISGLKALEAVVRSWPVVSKFKDALGFEELVKQSKSPSYKNVLDADFEIEAAKVGLDFRRYPQAQDIYLLSKDTPSPLPTLNNPWRVSLQGNEVVLRSWESTAGQKPVVGFFVDKSNYKNLFYGDYTKCCQKFGGMFEKLLHQFQQSPESTFLFVTLKGNPSEIISQSPVIKRGNVLVLEGIESAGHPNYMRAVEEVYEQAAKSLVQFHFERVELANTGRVKHLKIDVDKWPVSTAPKAKYPKHYKGPSDYWADFDQETFDVRLLASNPDFIKARKTLDQPEVVSQQLYTPATYVSIAEATDRDALLKLAKSVTGRKVAHTTSGDSSIALRTLEGEVIGYANLDNKSRTIEEILIKPGVKDADADRLLNAIYARMKVMGGQWKVNDQYSAFQRISSIANRPENSNANLKIDIVEQPSGLDRDPLVSGAKSTRLPWSLSTIFKRFFQ